MHTETWQLGIGDPTVWGWLTVGLYVLCALLTYRIAKEEEGLSKLLWGSALFLFWALALNKQLDLQTAVLDIIRGAVRESGHYEARRGLQYLFISTIWGIFFVALIALELLRRKLHKWDHPFIIAFSILLGFIVMRASSLHASDAFVNTVIFHSFKMNNAVEMGALLACLIAIGIKRHSLKEPNSEMAVRTI